MTPKVKDHLQKHKNEILDLLQRLVTIQSGSYNKAGVNLVADLIEERMTTLGMATKRLPHQEYGDTVVASSQASPAKKSILLIGHMDTVFPENTTFRAYREDADKVYGPGVADMKGGLVTGIWALETLASFRELNDIPLRFIFNPDEEVGSPVSEAEISEEASRSALALVLECGGMDGEVVTARKGRLGFDLEVLGGAGHAAFAEKEKASAVTELAHKVLGFESLNGRVSGLTVNVGAIEGGIGPNTVPEHARAELDVRFSDTAQLDLFIAEREKLLSRAQVENTAVRFKETSFRRPMERTAGNQDLFRIVAQIGQDMKIPVIESFRHGCSDANIVAHLGIPVLDGLGPQGDQDHSDREFILKDSLFERCELLVHTIRECARRYCR